MEQEYIIKVFNINTDEHFQIINTFFCAKHIYETLAAIDAMSKIELLYSITTENNDKISKALNRLWRFFEHKVH